MKFSRAIRRVKWLNGEKTMWISYQHPEDEDRDGLRNVGFFTVQPLDLADRPRELHFTQSPGKQQILHM
jgi:hypothetical protein